MTIDRRDFIQTTGLGAMGALSKVGRVIGKVTLTAPTQVKMDNYETHAIPHGTEYELAYTLTGAEGTAVKCKGFSRRIELEDSYSQTVIAVYSHAGEVILRMNQLVSGVKGEISGNVRYDDIEVTTLRDDGTAIRSAMPKTAVSLTNPVAGVPMEQVLALLSKYHEQTWTIGNKQTLQNFLESNAR
ncbi:MAG: hypothetical protein ACLP3K_18515 [Candidatus Acidiferrales bacterium]